MGELPGVTIVIVNYETPRLAVRCVHALAPERALVPGLEVIVVDNASRDNSVSELREGLSRGIADGWVRLLPLDFNGGFGWANNQAILHRIRQGAPPEFFHLLNPDAEIEPGAVACLLARLRSQPELAAAASQLVEPDGEDAGSCFRFPTVAREFLRGVNTPLIGRILGISSILNTRKTAGPSDWITGASVMFRSAALRHEGLFDDGFFLYFEEVELMWRLRKAGWELWFEPASRVMHIGGAATGVGSGSTVATKPRPAYWFHSRRRYFARTSGRTGVVMAGMAWLVGHAIWSLRLMLGLGSRQAAIPDELSGFLAHGLAPSAEDLAPAITRWDDDPGQMPRWSRQS